jgi:two-component system, sensor histidine kinase
MTENTLIAGIIANSQCAQAIHQNGVLVYANAAAARIFGFEDIRSFARFAEAKSLFAHDIRQLSATRTRSVKFKRVNQTEKIVHIIERDIPWNGAPSVHIELSLTSDNGVPVHRAFVQTEESDAQTFILDTIGAAMDWSRTDAGKLEVVRQPFSFADIGFKLYDDLSNYAQVRGVKLNIEVTSRAQRIFEGDALKMVHAAGCLIRFAIDKVLGGRVDVVLKADKRGDNIIFEVFDNGVPYKPTDPNILFELPVSELGPRIGEEIDANLNLPLARHIARFLGGEVHLKINHNKGGLLLMHLPFREVQHETPWRPRNGPQFKDLKILVVEDNPANQKVLQIILQTLGHTPTLVDNGRECVKILQRAEFDVVFMDLHMPIEDGYSATRRVRQLEAIRTIKHDGTIPIFAITADCRIETRNKAIAAGVTGFLTKPVHIPQIMGALATYVSAAIPQNLGHAKLQAASRDA